MKAIFVAALIVATLAQTPDECNQKTCSGNCAYGQTCCSSGTYADNMCHTASASVGIVPLGGACTAGTNPCTNCMTGSCVSSVCQVTGYAALCAGCSTDADCTASGGAANSCISNTCVQAGQNAIGATCDAWRQCQGGLSCSSGVCVASTVGQWCNTGFSISNGAGDLSNCSASQFCNTSTWKCQATWASGAGSVCQAGYQCQSGICGTGTYGILSQCTAAGLLTTGQSCWSVNEYCASGFCQAWNSTRIICSANGLQSRKAGQSCWTDDECVVGSNCTGNGYFGGAYGPTTQGTCSTPNIGTACSPLIADSDVTSPCYLKMRQMGTLVNAYAVYSTCMCSGPGGSYQCGVTGAMPATCASLYTAALPVIVKYGVSYYNPVNAGPGVGDANTLAAYYCCSACKDTVTYPGGLTGKALAATVTTAMRYVKYGFDCRSNVVAALTAAQTATRCTKNVQTTLTPTDMFISCTPAAASSLVPSVALLAAVIAAFFALLA
jgi:hypothetical protein